MPEPSFTSLGPSDDDRDKVQLLEELDVLAAADDQDLAIDQGVQRRILSGVDTAEEGPVSDLISAFSIQDQELELVPSAGGSVMLKNGEKLEYVTHWPSRTAAALDVSIANLLADRDDRWSDISLWDRLHLAESVRAFIEKCPQCRDQVRMSESTVETCCDEYQAAVIDCPKCEVRLLEMK